MEPHHLGICSTLLNVPLKLKGRSRIRLGFGFFFVFYHYISVPLSAQYRCRKHRRKTAGLPVLSSGRCFPPGGASCCFHGPFPGRVIYLFCSSPRQLRRRPLEPSASAFSFSGVFALLQKSGIRKTAKALDFQRKIRLIFCFILLILFRILPKKPGKNNPRGEMK